MKETVKKVIDFINRYSLLPNGQKVLCAVSGGADSMCLLHLMKEFEDTLHIHVAAAHFEHGIRGAESLRDLSFVRDYCEENYIPFMDGRGDVPVFAAANGLGTEEAARMLRYEFLEKARAELSCDVIATAHNMNDNAETVIFNLTRGAGTAGLCGIPPKRGNIIRPLLCLSRTEIEDYLRENGIPHVEDSTNSDETFSRNRIRHRIIPEMNAISPQAVEAVFRASMLLREDELCLSEWADSFIFSEQRKNSAGAVCISREKLCALPVPVASRVIRKLVSHTISREQTDEIMKISRSAERKQIDLPDGSVVSEQGMVSFYPDTVSGIGKKREIVFSPVRIVPDSSVTIPELHITVSCERCVYRGEVYDLLNTFYIKCAQIYGQLFCTVRQPGDRLRIKERKCTKTLKSLFEEAKMTSDERNAVPVFRDEKGIAAVGGLGVSERLAVTFGDEALKISIEREKEN